MIKGVALVGVLTLFSLGTVQHGCEDAKKSLTHLNYYPIRDMRATVAFVPQHKGMYPPDSLAVNTRGTERLYGLEGGELADKLGGMLTNPVAATDSSIARGALKFTKNCIPCHGTTLAGDGPVAALFMPPPDLLAEATRARKDGYIYSYIRHGGIVMPSYGPAVTAEEAWNLVNYIRHMQKISPR